MVLAAVALLSVGALLLVVYRSSEQANGTPFDAALSAAGGADAISKLFSHGASSKVCCVIVVACHTHAGEVHTPLQ